MKKTMTFFAMVAMFATASIAQGINTFPWTEGFEDGASGWIFQSGNAEDEGFSVVTNMGQYVYTTMGQSCLFGPYSDDFNVDQWAISPLIDLTNSTDDTLLSYYVYMTEYDGIETEYEVRVSTTDTTIASFTTVLWSETGSGDGYVKRNVSLAAYAGQTIRIAFHNITGQGGDAMMIDNVRIGGPETPSLTLYGPQNVVTNVPTTFVAVSDVAGPFTWTVDNQAQTTTTDTLVYTFTTAGSHTVVASVSNNVGTTTDTINVTAIECNAESVPYSSNFANGISLCWENTALTPETYAWDTVSMADGSATYAYSMSAESFYGVYMFDNGVDNWLITPTLNIATAGDYQVEWMVREYNSSYATDHYTVYLIADDDTTELFSETLTAEAAAADLARVAGLPADLTGDFKIGFRHHASTGGYVLMIRNIGVNVQTAPSVTLVGPATAENGYAVTFTAQSGNATSYAWLVDGTAQSETSNTLSYTFTTDSVHTVKVTATNNSGSASDSMTVEVYTCYAIADFPYTQDFESGMQCWSMVSMDAANDAEFGIYADENAYAGSSDFRFSSFDEGTDYNQYLISPEITLPATGNYMLKFMYKGQYSTDAFRVLSSTTTKDVAAFTNVLGDYPEVATAWTEVALVLPAGTKFVAINYYGDYQYRLYVDDIMITTVTAPTVTVTGPASTTTGSEVTFTATSTLADSYAWTVDGTAQSETGNTLTYTFTTAGEHTVSVVATNAQGSSQPATHTINVIACDVISTLPWVADFEDTTATYDCWKFYDADQDGIGWFTSYGQFQNQDGTPAETYGHESYGAMFSFSYYSNGQYGQALTPDDWVFTPAIAVPAEGNYSLSWYARGIDPNYAGEYYSVYVTTTAAPDESLEAVYSDSTTATWEQQIVNLADYAGQTVYIAFRHHNCTNKYALAVDKIRVGVAGSENEGIDNAAAIDINIYPNPASEVINIAAEGVRLVEMLDVNGRVVLESRIGGAIDLSSLASGVYMVRVTTDAGVSTEKVVKQ